MKRLQETWKAGDGAVNAWLSTPNAIVAEITGEYAFDSITIDLQHGLIDYQAALSMLQALRGSTCTPLVRVPWLEPGIIMKCLDAGAMGIICPMINSQEDAAALVRYTQYAPIGARSFGPTRVGMVYGPDYASQANKSITVLAMIETAEAYRNVLPIVGTPGLSGVYIGPSDLGLSLGYEPKLDQDDPNVMKVIKTILSAAHQGGVKAGIHCQSPVYAKRMLSEKFDLVTVGSDIRLYRSAVSSALELLNR